MLSGTIVGDSLSGAMMRWWGCGEDLRVGGTYKDKSVLLLGGKGSTYESCSPLEYTPLFSLDICDGPVSSLWSRRQYVAVSLRATISQAYKVK